MTEPRWIERSTCEAIHISLLARFGGIEGIRDEGLLESALNRPLDMYHYGSPTLHGLAAAYAHGIVKNHPFLDGNKRTGFVTAALFLETNGANVTASEAEAVVQTVALAAGDIDGGIYAEWLRRNSEPPKSAEENSG